ncbi:hypothetical protein DFJ77DRAFT_445965 [Powellomyces hirtus]|nr:hypothetical protein DFJ77DRAFT_445965 [Powellomyces hirtus]
MGPQLFNNAHNATCILRIIDSGRPFDEGFASVGPLDQFYWVHEVILVAKSLLFKQAFSTRSAADEGQHNKVDTIGTQAQMNMQQQPYSEYPHTHYDNFPITTAKNGIMYQWQGIRTGADPAIPIITPYPRNGRVGHPRRSTPGTSDKWTAWSTTTTVTSRPSSSSSSSSSTATTATSRQRTTLPLLTVCLPYIPMFPETLYWLYTNNDARFNRALNLHGREHMAEALGILEHLGVGVGTRSKRPRNDGNTAAAPQAAEPSTMRRKSSVASRSDATSAILAASGNVGLSNSITGPPAKQRAVIHA